MKSWVLAFIAPTICVISVMRTRTEFMRRPLIPDEKAGLSPRIHLHLRLDRRSASQAVHRHVSPVSPCELSITSLKLLKKGRGQCCHISWREKILYHLQQCVCTCLLLPRLVTLGQEFWIFCCQESSDPLQLTCRNELGHSSKSFNPVRLNVSFNKMTELSSLLNVLCNSKYIQILHEYFLVTV